MKFIAFKRVLLAALTIAAVSVAATAFADGPARPAHMDTGDTVAAKKGMKVSIKVKADKMKGHNLFIKTSRFRWAPEHASGKHVSGEGHAHLFVDGTKVTRLYGPAYYIGNLTTGQHTVMVSLNGNNHATYARNGKEIKDSFTVTVP